MPKFGLGKGKGKRKGSAKAGHEQVHKTAKEAQEQATLRIQAIMADKKMTPDQKAMAIVKVQTGADKAIKSANRTSRSIERQKTLQSTARGSAASSAATGVSENAKEMGKETVYNDNRQYTTHNYPNQQGEGSVINPDTGLVIGTTDPDEEAPVPNVNTTSGTSEGSPESTLDEWYTTYGQ